MKKFTDWYQSSALVVGALTLMAIAYYQRREMVLLKEENKKYQLEVQMVQGGDIQKENATDSMQSVIDSMYAENLINEIELNRYRVAYEIFLERNRKAAEEYGTIISNETE
jgi:hypothetical protein